MGTIKPKAKTTNTRQLRKKIDLRTLLKKVPNGFALISVTILLGILLAFSFILLNASLNTRFVGNVFQQALSSEQIAEAGLHKALFCIKATTGTNCGGTNGASYAGESNVSFGGGTFSTSVTGVSPTLTVTSVGTSITGQTKRVKSDISALPPTTSMTMTAAVQAGASGISMSNNVVVIGDGSNVVTDSDVTSIGDIVCGNNAQISGNVSVTRSGGKIDSCKVTRNAYADLLTNDKITKDAYYLTPVSGISGSTVGGTKYPNSPTPVPIAMPNLDIPYWESVASAGTVFTGDVNLSGSNNVLGPEKIIGNLTLSNGTVLTLTGPLYVTGNVDISNNSTVKLDPSFGAASGVFIADGTINISNNGNIQGSGTAGSVIIVVSNSNSMSNSAPAIMAENNVTGAVLYAPNGEVHTSNNANVPAVVGLKVVMDNNTTVNYGSLNIFNAPINVAASGSGTGWHIQPNSWREFK